MSKTSKIIVTVVIGIVFFAIFSAIVGTRQSAGQSTPGFFGLMLFASLIAALSAIWKKKKE